MTRWSWSRTASIALVPLVVSGCIDFGGEELAPFGTIEAPQWSPGHTWTWDTNSERRSTESGPEGTHASSGSYNSTIAQTVVGTAGLADDAQGWVVQREGEAEEPMGGSLFQGDGLALVPAGTLEAVAVSYSFGSCIGPETVNWHEAYRDGPSPLVEFPVAQGGTWSGDDGFVTWKAEALGMSSVRVPAGTFEAVLVSFTASVRDSAAEPAPVDPYEGDHRERFEEFSFSMKVWYAPAVEHVVRVDSHLKIVVEEEDEGRFSMESSNTMKLVAFDLATTDGETYPSFVQPHDPWDVRKVPAVHIVSDTPLPLNAATGNRTVTFGLGAGPESGDDGIPVVDAVEAYDLGKDFEGYTIRWTVRGPGIGDGWSQEEQYGMTFTTDLPPGGWYEIGAQLWYGPPPPQPVEIDRVEIIALEDSGPMPTSVPASMPVPVSSPCFAPMRHFGMHLAFAQAEVFWEEAYEAEFPAGEPGRINLGSFEAVQGGWATVDTQVTAPAPGVYDDTQAILVAPSGEEHWLSDGGTLLIEEPGQWLLDWDVRGVTGKYGLETIAAGHAVRAELLVDY